MIHQRTPLNFRVTEWPSSSTSHFRVFNQPKLRYDLSQILEYLALALFDTNKAFVRYSSFSLINVSSPISGTSFGYRGSPYYKLINFHPLSFTFAFTYRDLYYGMYPPVYQLRPKPQVNFWGFSLAGNSDFMTINVPKRVLRDAGITTLSMRDMEWLYMAVGAWSKGFVRRFQFFTRRKQFRDDPISLSTARSTYYHRKLQNMFKFVPWNRWIYSRDIWNLAPNMLSARALNEDNLDYYCRYLSQEFYRKYSTINVRRIEAEAYEYLESGVIDALQMLSNNETDAPSRNYLTVLALLDNDLSKLQDKSDVSAIVRNLLQGNPV